MNSLFLRAGQAAGFLGLAICAFAAIVRLSGQYWIAGFQLGTLLLGGIACIAAGCFLLLLRIADERNAAAGDQ